MASIVVNVEISMPAAHTSIRRLNRGLNRSLNRRLNRRCLRSINRRITSGRGPAVNHLSRALFALGKTIRAGQNLARLAPEVFDMARVAKDAAQAEQQAALRVELESALTRAYGPAADPPSAEPEKPGDPLARYSRRTLHAIERETAARELWLTIGRQAWHDFRRTRPHARIGLGQIARVLSIASKLGRLATGLDTSRSASSPPPLETPDFRAALDRLYGDSELTSAKL